MTAEHAFDTPNYQATSAKLADNRTPQCDHAAGDVCFRCCEPPTSDLERAAGARIAEQILEQRPFAQPTPVTPAEAATAQVLDDLPAPPAAVDLDQLADPAPLAWYTAIEDWDAEIAALEDQIVPLKEKRERASEIIQAAMGDAEEARIKGRPVVTWKTSKPAQRLDRKALEAAYGADVIAGFLVDNKAARPFKILPRRGGAR